MFTESLKRNFAVHILLEDVAQVPGFQEFREVESEIFFLIWEYVKQKHKKANR